MGQENNAFSNLDERSTQDSQNKSNKVELYKIKSWRQDESQILCMDKYNIS